MYTRILITLAIALASAAFNARADWLEASPSLQIDSALMISQQGTTTIMQLKTKSGAWERRLLRVRAHDCDRGYGVMQTTRLDGTDPRRWSSFTLRNQSVTLGDSIGQYLCGSYFNPPQPS